MELIYWSLQNHEEDCDINKLVDNHFGKLQDYWLFIAGNREGIEENDVNCFNKEIRIEIL